MSERTKQKAKRLISQGLIGEVGVQTFQVQSESNPNNSYILTVERGEVFCECKGFEYRKTCSHKEAVEELMLQS